MTKMTLTVAMTVISDPVTDTVLLMPDEKMDIDEEQPRQHQTLEFFEMCASLITTLAR